MKHFAWMALWACFALLARSSLAQTVVINEIHYHPASQSPRNEFIELFNRASTNINLSGWRLTGGLEFTLPAGTQLGGGKYLVVAADLVEFGRRYPGVTNVVGSWLRFTVTNVNGIAFTNFTPVLGNTGDTVQLEDLNGARVDSVTYSDDGDWAVRRRGLSMSGHRGWMWWAPHDGLGNSLELVNPNLPNDAGQNWAASATPGGTPGAANSIFRANSAPLILGAQHQPLVPRSTEQVSISARIVDEAASGLTVALNWRVDSGTPGAFNGLVMADDGAHGDGGAGDGVYGALLAPMTNGTLVEFFIEARDAQGNSRTWPAPALNAPDLNTNILGQVANVLFQVDDAIYPSGPPLHKLLLTSSEYAELGDIFSGAPNSDAQMNATFITIDGLGTECRYRCGVRNRGHGSRSGSPHNYRVNVPSSQPWKGLTALNLNARTVAAQVAGAALAQKAGVAGNNSRVGQLRVNGDDGPGGRPEFGLYAVNEDINSDWAGRAFPFDGRGNIYSVVRDNPPPNFDYRGDNPETYQNTYFKQSNVSEDDWRDLMGMLQVMGENQTPEFSLEAARRVINVEQWLRHVAVMSLFGNNESGINTGNNDDYYLYRGLEDPRFVLVYHDLDTILSRQLGALEPSASVFGSTCCPISGDTEGIWRTMDFFLHHPQVEPLYYRTLQDLLDTTFSQAQFNSTLNQLFTDYPQFGSVVAGMKDYMNQRRNAVLGAIAGLVPPATNAPLATVRGEPRSPTWRSTATLTVGGTEITHYQWRLNSGPWSGDIPVATPISISGLGNGSSNVVEVVGRNAGGIYQSRATPTVSASWIVNTSLPTVRLNEVLAKNDSALNVSGTFPDAIELYNEGTGPVDLSGMRLSDDPAEPDKFTFPTLTLPAGAYLTVYANEPDGTPGLHVGFALGQNGGTVQLYHRLFSGGGLLDSVTFGLQVADLSIGRVDNSGDWVLGPPTFGAANGVQALGDPQALRLNEWFAAGAPPTSEDYVELFNTDSRPISLGGLYLSDEPLGAPKLHRISRLSFVRGGSYVTFTADGAENAGAEHLNFRLPAEQGQIQLSAADGTALDNVVYGSQRVGVSTGRCPDGSATFRVQGVLTPNAPNICPPPSEPLLLPMVALTNNWRYLQGVNLDGALWMTSAYDDSSWPSGPGLLGRPRNGFTPPEPVRTPLVTNLTRTTFYFRTRFNVTSVSSLTSLQISNFIDDGAVFYLNGAEIPSSRLRIAAGLVSYNTLASSVADPSWEGPLNVPLSSLRLGENVLAVEVHQAATNSQDIMFGLRLDGVSANTIATDIVLNEVLAHNVTATQVDGRTPDWIELYNPTATAIDLAGLSLNDVPNNNPPGWFFPPGSIIPAGGYFAVQADGGQPASALNTGFGLNAKGGAVFLFRKAPQTNAVLDWIEYGLQTPDYSIGRVPSGSSRWVLTVPTPGDANVASALGDPLALRINEWMADPASGDDWFELYNRSTTPVDLSNLRLTDTYGNPDAYRIPALSFIGVDSNAFIRFEADEPAEPRGPEHVNFKLSRNGDAIYLLATNNGTILDAVSFEGQQTGVSQGRLPDGSSSVVSFVETPTPGDSNFLPLPNVVVNEVLTHTDPPLEDAIELRNLTAVAVNIGGWFLSDSKDSLRKFRIPAGTSIPGNGYTVFYEIQFNNDTNGVPFGLSSSDGDQVYLSAANANGTLTGYRASARFGAAENGVSFGRYQNTAGEVDYAPMSQRSFGVNAPVSVAQFRTGTGASNAYPSVGPIVISEIMYHPPDLVLGGVTNDNVIEEFIELYNAGATSVPLFDPLAPANTWRVRDAVEFDFPPNRWLTAGSYALLVSFDPVANLSARAQFQARYGSNSVLFGPYSGKLDNSSDRIALYKPDPPNTNGLVPYVLVEQVHYAERSPWPLSADGAGDSLQRRAMLRYANEPTNWVAGVPGPGPAGLADTDGDGMPDDWENQYGFNRANAADANQDADGDGMTNLQEYLAGTEPKQAGSLLRVNATRTGSGGVLLSFTAVAGRSYSVLYKDRLTDAVWVRWTTVPPQTATQTFTVQDGPAALPQRFYRVLSP